MAHSLAHEQATQGPDFAPGADFVVKAEDLGPIQNKMMDLAAWAVRPPRLNN